MKEKLEKEAEAGVKETMRKTVFEREEKEEERKRESPEKKKKTETVQTQESGEVVRK